MLLANHMAPKRRRLLFFLFVSILLAIVIAGAIKSLSYRSNVIDMPVKLSVDDLQLMKGKMYINDEGLDILGVSSLATSWSESVHGGKDQVVLGSELPSNKRVSGPETMGTMVSDYKFS